MDKLHETKIYISGQSQNKNDDIFYDLSQFKSPFGDPIYQSGQLEYPTPPLNRTQSESSSSIHKLKPMHINMGLLFVIVLFCTVIYNVQIIASGSGDPNTQEIRKNLRHSARGKILDRFDSERWNHIVKESENSVASNQTTSVSYY